MNLYIVGSISEQCKLSNLRINTPHFIEVCVFLLSPLFVIFLVFKEETDPRLHSLTNQCFKREKSAFHLNKDNELQPITANTSQVAMKRSLCAL